MVGYGALAFMGETFLGWRFRNGLKPIPSGAPWVLVRAAANSKVDLSEWLLRRLDFSEENYLLQRPIVNYFLHIGRAGSAEWLATAMLWTVVSAFLSWRVVEKPAWA